MRSFSSLFFLFSFFLAVGQSHLSVSYTDKDVLPNKTVRGLYRAIDGALWIGTDNGLVRKFNDQFKTFSKEDGLAQNNIWAIEQDDDNTLWIGSYGNGLSIYNDGKITPYLHNNQLVHPEVTKLKFYKNFLYVGTSDGISIIDIKSRAIITCLKPQIPTEEKFRIQDFFVINDYMYAVSYAHGMFKIKSIENIFQLSQVTDEKQIYAAYLYKDSLFIGRKEFYNIIIDDDFSSLNLSKSTAYKSSIFWDFEETGSSLFAAAWGIYQKDGGVYEWKNGHFINRNADFGIHSTQITSLEYDEVLDRLFVGTLDKGLYEVSLNKTISFKELPNKKVIDMALSGHTTAYLLSNGLQIGAHMISAQSFKKWQEDFVKGHQGELPAHEDFFYELDYTTAAADIIFYEVKVNDDRFWVNTSIGLYVFNEDGQFHQYLPLHTLEFNFTNDNRLIETNFYHGTRVYEKLEPLTYQYFDNLDNKNHPSHIVGSARLNSNTYFTSIFSGLYEYRNGKFTSYTANDIWNEKRLRHITALGDKNLAISNEDGDVFIYNTAKPKPIKKIARNNKYGATINFLTSYNKTIIIGTAKGVVLYTGDREIFINKEQGLHRELTCGMVKSDTLLLGSNEGIYKIALKKILQQPDRIKNIHIDDFRVNGINQPIPAVRFKFAHDKNSIQLALSTNQHPYPNKLVYSYRINHKDPWDPLEASVINLAYLQPGHYDIEVKVEDASTGAIFKKSMLKFTIDVPFYKSWWFITLCFAVVVGLVIFYFSLKRKRAKQQAVEKEAITKRIEEVKLEALLSQMNPHFVFNSLNSIQYFISNQDNDRAMQYLGTFSTLIRANLNNSTKQYLSLEEEIEYLRSYCQLENARFDNRIKVIFNIDKMLNLAQTSIPNMVVQPFVENAFVHAFPKKIEQPVLKISFQRIDVQRYRCIIKDNGIGNASFDKKRHHYSKGTQLVHERLSFLGYDPIKALQVSYNDKGTIVTLNLEV